MITIKEGYREPSAENTLTGGKKYKRVFVVSTDDTSNGMEAYILAQLPKINDPYPNDLTATVSSVSVQLQEELNFTQWEATIEYEQKDYDPDNPDNDQGFQRNLQVSARTQQYEVPFEAAYTADNKRYDAEDEIIIPVVSTSNEKLLVSVYESNIIVDINQNVANFDFDWVKQFKNSTNAKAGKIVGVDVGVDQARILDISPSSQVDTLGQVYYNVSMSVEITDKDFLLRPMNEGFMKKDPDLVDTTATKFILKQDIGLAEVGTDTGLEKIDEKARLDLKNQPIPNSVTGAKYVPFKAHLSLDWSVLDIPSNQP